MHRFYLDEYNTLSVYNAQAFPVRLVHEGDVSFVAKKRLVSFTSGSSLPCNCKIFKSFHQPTCFHRLNSSRAHVRLPTSVVQIQSDLIVILAFKGNFSHTMKTFCFSHLQLGSIISKSNCQRRLAKISRISNIARLRPRQFLGPVEKGLNGEPGAPDLWGLLVGDSHRSGMKAEGESGKFRAEWLEA